MKKGKILLWILGILVLSSFGFGGSLEDDTQAYYKLDSDTEDSTSNNYDLTNNGANNIDNGIINGAYNFADTTDYMRGNYYNFVDETFILSVDSGSLRSYYGGWRNSITPISINTWYHIVATYNGTSGDYKIYANNDLKQTYSKGTGDDDFSVSIWINQTASGGGEKRFFESNTGNSRLTIGTEDALSTSFAFTGVIDEIGIFNKTLNSTEIEFLYNSGSPNSTQQYPFTPPTPSATNLTNVTFTTNIYDGLQLTNYNLTINGSTYETFNGTIKVELNKNILYDVNVNASSNNSDFYKTYYNYNITNNLSINYSILNLSVYNIKDSNYINNFNVSCQKFLLGPVQPIIYNSTTNGNLYFFLEDTNKYDLITNTEDIDNIRYRTDLLDVGINNYQFNITYINVSSNIYDGLQLTNYNLTINGSTYETFNGSLTIYIDDPYSTYDINVKYLSNYSYINKTYYNYNVNNDLLINYSILNISVKNIISNLSISNFSLYNKDFDKYITSNNSKILLYLNNDSYSPLNVTLLGDLIATQNETLNYSGYNITDIVLYAYKSNSILINIYDAITSLLINDTNITIQFIYDGGLFSNITSTGTFFISNLTEGDYELKFTSSNYSDATYYVTVGNSTTQKLNVYMLNTPSNTIFTFKDSTTENIIPDVTFSVQQIINNSWVLVNVLTSDVSGRISFDYNENGNYKFLATNSNYETKNFTLNPILFSSYNIWLDKIASETSTNDLYNVDINIYPLVFYNNQLNNISIIFSSSSGNYQIYGYNISYKTDNYINTGNNAYGETFNESINISGAGLTDVVFITYYYMDDSNIMKNFELRYPIIGSSNYGTNINAKNKYGLGLIEVILILTFVCIFMGGAAYIYGGIISAGILISFILGYFTFIGFVSGWLTIPTIIILFILVSWGIK